MGEKIPINVLVISDYSDYHSTRPEASIYLGIDKLKFRIHILCPEKGKFIHEFKSAGIELFHDYPEKRIDFKRIKSIRKILIDRKIHILHLYNNKAIINGIRAAKGINVKTVLYRGYSGNISWLNPLSYLKFLHPRVNMIMCNSKGVEEYIHSQSIIRKPKTITINKGHSVQWYEKYNPHSIREELGISKNSFLMVNVCNNRRMKGIPILLRAFNSLHKHQNIHLLLIGRNLDTKKNKKIIKRGSNHENVHFLGFRKDVLNIVAASNVFVLSSIKGESITKSVIEAMSLGIPAVISDIPGNRELLIHMVSGLKFKSENVGSLIQKIKLIYKDSVLKKQLGINAKLQIEKNLNHQLTIQKIERLYQELTIK